MDARALARSAAAALVTGGSSLLPCPAGPSQRAARELAAADSRFATVGDVEVHHTVAGPEGAPALLLAHHFYGSAWTWRKVQALLRDDHRAIAWDRPGFGLTERPRGARGRGRADPYTRAAAARLGWGLLDHLGVDRAVLVGSSAGGTNALEMYARAPRRVRALVLLSPAITGDVGPPPRLRPLLRGPLARSIAPLVARRIAGEITVERVARGWHDPSMATADDAVPYEALLRVQGWERAIWALMTAEGPPDLRALLGRVDVPTLVVGGSSDRTISTAWNRRTAAAIPGARYVELPRAGHTPQEEAPERLVAALRSFLAVLPD